MIDSCKLPGRWARKRRLEHVNVVFKAKAPTSESSEMLAKMGGIPCNVAVAL